MSNKKLTYSELENLVSELESKLTERVKELDCISKLSQLVDISESIGDVLAPLTNILKQSMQFPRITEVKISYKDYNYQTENFKNTKWVMHSDIIVKGKIEGEINVVYLENPTNYDNPFLEEEYNLLNIVSEYLERIVERIQKTELFDTLLEGIIKTDIDGIIIDANPEAAKIFGFKSPNNLIGKPIVDLYENPEMRHQIIKELRQNGGIIHNFEYQVKRKDNSTLPVMSNIRMLFDYENKYVGTLVAISDVSERKNSELALKKSEHDLKSVIENISFAVFAHNLDGNVVMVNELSTKYTGYSKDELLSMNVSDIDKESINRNDRELVWKKLYKKDEVIRFTSNHYRKNNSTYPVEVSTTAIKLNEKPVILAIVQDITERKNREDELTRLNNDKDKFISILAHDLKNPFNSLLGFSKLLIDNIGKFNVKKTEEYAHIINKMAQKTYNLLEDMLLWSRAQSGKIVFKPDTFNFYEACNSIIEEVDNQALSKKISIKSYVPATLRVFTDVNLVKTVIRNLVSNAIKFTNNGGLISIDAKEIKNKILVSIADNGVGIHKDNLSQLFNIAIDNTTKGTNNETGTGLGLQICKDFVEKMGGDIWVESEVGKGSVFYFTIPKK